MKGSHLTEDSIRRLRAQELSPAETVAAFRHIAECDRCAGLARDASEDDVENLRALLEADAAMLPPKPRPRRFLLAAAAVLAAIAAGTLLLLPDRTPDPVPAPRTATAVTLTTPPSPSPAPPARYADAGWNRLVDEALASGRLPEPDLTLPRRTSDALRGAEDERGGVLAPAGAVVENPRPTLTWPRVDGATYIVSIFDGDVEVTHSETLHAERWQPPRALQRGRTYTWQVEANTGASSEVLPAPPAPPAMFHVLGAREQAAIDDARRQHPDDDLLLAVLYARAGLTKKAAMHARRLASSPDPRVRRLSRQ